MFRALTSYAQKPEGVSMSAQRVSPPFRADHVGSLIRPRELIEARQAYQAGNLPGDALRAIEDEVIRDTVKMQERVHRA